MRLATLYPARATLCAAVASCLVGSASAYFKITEPTSGSQWQNGAANPVYWTKGLLDGIDTFDIELARLSTDGLLFVARDVPTNQGSAINIMVQDVPAADDYFLLFLNSTHGVMYSVSPKFTILATGQTPNGTAAKPASAATVTVSGSPNPTAVFATTFPAQQNGAVAWPWAGRGGALGLLAVMCGCALGAAMTVL